MERARKCRHDTVRAGRGRPGRILAAFAAFCLVITVLVQPLPPAAATADDEAAFVVAINQIRADNGLAPFTVNSQLADLARAHAGVMAEAGEIFHADPISTGFTGAWLKLGENVGVGAGVGVLVDAFVQSPGHFANIIDPAFTEIGVGVVWLDDALYTTHRFLQPPEPPPTTAPPTTIPPTTAPPTTTTEPATTTTTTVAPPTTTTTLAPLPPPAIAPARVVALIEMIEQLGR